MLDCLNFDDFWHLEAAEQAKHMHMGLICLPEILKISEIVKIEKNKYFQFVFTNFHLGVNIAIVDWQNVAFSRSSEFLTSRSCRASKTYAYAYGLLAGRKYRVSRSRKLDLCDFYDFLNF